MPRGFIAFRLSLLALFFHISYNCRSGRDNISRMQILFVISLGQERFRSMARSYYHDAVGTLLVYDITNRTSFGAVEQWLGDARQLATPGVVVILVGNKKDLQDTDGQVTHWEANTFAQENGLQFIETSALTGENIDDAFTSCVRVLLSKVKSGELGADRLLGGSNKQHLQAVNLTATATSVSASESSAATAHPDTCLC